MQTGHETRTIRLMKAIPERFTKTLCVARSNGPQEQREMLQIEDRIKQRQSPRQRPARDRCRQLRGGRRDDDSPFRRPGPLCHGNRPVGRDAAARQAAEERWRGIVRVSLNLRRFAQQLVFRPFPIDEFAKPQPRNRRGRAAAQSASQRNLAANIDDERRTSPPRRWCVPECLFDPVRTAERPVSKTAFQPATSVVHHGRNAHPQIQTDGNTNRVEPRAEIGNRRRDDDLLTRPPSLGLHRRSGATTRCIRRP
jgi:hypothetical protein